MEKKSPSQTCLARSHSALLDVLRQFGVEKKKTLLVSPWWIIGRAPLVLCTLLCAWAQTVDFKPVGTCSVLPELGWTQKWVESLLFYLKKNEENVLWLREKNELNASSSPRSWTPARQPPS